MGLLFGYLLGVIVLVGSGIGALNWLVAPDPTLQLTAASKSASKTTANAHAVPRRIAENTAAKSEPIFKEEEAVSNVVPAAVPAAVAAPAVPAVSEAPAKLADDSQLADDSRPAEGLGRPDIAPESTGESKIAMPVVATPVIETQVPVSAPMADASALDQAPSAIKEETPTAQAKSHKVKRVARASASRKADKSKFAQRSDRPLQMMILRTYERPDGSVSRELIPFSAAGAFALGRREYE